MTSVPSFLSRLARFAWTLIIVLLVPLSALGIIVLLLELGDQTIPYSTALAVLRLIATTLATFLTVGLFLAILWVFRALLRLRSHLTASPLGLLLGIALAALVFTRGAYAILVYPPWYTIRAARQFFDFTIPLASRESSVAVTGADILDNTAAMLWGIATRFLETGTDFWNALPVAQTLFATALWAIVASFTAPDTQGSTRTRFHAWWHGLDEPGRALAGVFVALAFGSYLSIAAIIAIPWLESDGRDTQGLTKEHLQQQLLRSDSIARSATPLGGDTTQFAAAISALMSLADTGLTQAARLPVTRADKGSWQLYFPRQRRPIEQIVQDRRTFLGLANRRRDASQKSLREIADRAVGAYTTNASQQMTSAERVLYFQSLVDWARDATDARVGELDMMAEAVAREDASAMVWANRSRGVLQDALLAMAQQGADTTTAQIMVGDLDTGVVPFSDNYLPRGPLINAALPAPPEPGSGWGPFGTVAKWLLRTRAVALAQIAGMLGFGLFGAAISLLRWRDQKTELGMADIPSVLLNGFSATMVIFLAVKGGLAVFTQGATQPNSYVLFFACLIGAVFSQDVWKWARDRLAKTLAG